MSAEQQAAKAAAPSAPALWAIVEIFGHTRIAGRISEQSFGGAALVRVDVPPVTVPENDGESTVTTAAPDPAPSATTNAHEFDAGIVALPPEPCVMITLKPPVV